VVIVSSDGGYPTTQPNYISRHTTTVGGPVTQSAIHIFPPAFNPTGAGQGTSMHITGYKRNHIGQPTYLYRQTGTIPPAFYPARGSQHTSVITIS